MKLAEETTCIGAPGFAGFVPHLRYEYGKTYGNATRHILHVDPSLKQGKIQQEFAKTKSASKEPVPTAASNKSVSPAPSTDGYVWKMKNKYQTGDDRFSFPPVPGYTGFIPHSREHFGQSYVNATSAALSDFQTSTSSRGQLPKRVQDKVEERAKSVSSPTLSSPTSSHGNGFFTYSATAAKIDDVTPYSAPKGHPNQTFISGYTGFVPRLQKHFGEPYPASVRDAIEEFNGSKVKVDPYKEKPFKTAKHLQIDSRPIPGSTVFIPGHKYGFATTFGKASDVAYAAFNQSQKTGKVPDSAPNSSMGQPLPPKDLKKNRPIPGYRGHIPGKAFDL